MSIYLVAHRAIFRIKYHKMNYSIKATSIAGNDASLTIKKSNINFGTSEKTAESLPNPTELFLGAFASCLLKNVERFSDLLKFEYKKAMIHVEAVRLEQPPRLDNIRYELEIFSADQNLNTKLLKRNIEKFGTIYNTVGMSCEISGEIIRLGIDD